MKARAASVLGRWLVVIASVVLTACSSFEAKWRDAAGGNPSSATRWDGRWTSEKHRTSAGQPEGGRLRCVLRAEATKTLRADFRANWLIFASSFTMELTPVRGSPTDFRGTHELPKIFGGTYRYTARIVGDRFSARYDSSYDSGVFDLTRVRP